MNYRGLQASARLLASIAPVSLLVTVFLSMSYRSITPVQAQSPQNLSVITIGQRFSPNPLEVKGVAGGDTPVKDVVKVAKTPTGECVGNTNAKPNHTVELTDFFESLRLVVQSADDTALTIQGPGGIWCNDDYQGKNPGVTGEWLPGTYKIWVSSYAKDRVPTYVLRISEKRQ